MDIGSDEENDVEEVRLDKLPLDQHISEDDKQNSEDMDSEQDVEASAPLGVGGLVPVGAPATDTQAEDSASDSDIDI